MTSADRLLSKVKINSKLYDVGSMMEMEPSVASGFVVLLNGGPLCHKSSWETKNSNRNNGNEGLPLAFMSLTSGNVIEACFGVENPSLRDDTPARHSANKAKVLLNDRDTTDSFRQIAVSAYCGGFEAVINHNEQIDKLNCFTKCFRSNKIRDETEEKIRASFASLVMALGDSS